MILTFLTSQVGVYADQEDGIRRYIKICVHKTKLQNCLTLSTQVTKNSNISADRRNQGVILSADGVPYFKDMGARSGWPFVIRSANLPDGIATDMYYAHMIALQTTDMLTRDNETGKLKRDKR